MQENTSKRERVKMTNYRVKQATPRWRDLKDQNIDSCFHYQQYMIKNHGFVDGWLKGGIGFGSKVHEFRCCYKIEGDIIYVAHLMSLCGSARFGSGLYLSTDQDYEVTCKKCHPNK